MSEKMYKNDTNDKENVCNSFFLYFMKIIKNDDVLSDVLVNITCNFQ